MAQISDLALLLLQKTGEGKLDWTRLAERHSKMTIGLNTVTIEAEERVYTLIVRNDDG